MNLTSDSTTATKDTRFFINVLIKALILFLIFNLVFAAWRPISELGRYSFYNLLFPGRLRLPYGENPQKAYNLNLYNLPAMFASQELAGVSKSQDEYRVVLIGDSSTWGFLLPAEETLSQHLNTADLTRSNGQRVRTYNLGYPVMSLTKDLLILSLAMQYQPDLIVWLVTLESFPYDKQLFPPLLQNNPQAVRKLIETYQLPLDPNSPELVDPSWSARTILGSRRALADLVRLQLYGVMWAATGIDQDIPGAYTPRMEDLAADESFHELLPPHLPQSALAFEVISAGHDLVGDIPILMINEPMFTSQGENSHIRYNFYYPRWAYDQYRDMMRAESAAKGWRYLDLWDAIPSSEFTNSAVHLTPRGSYELAQLVGAAILQIADSP